MKHAEILRRANEQIIDACTTDSQSRHDNALAAFKGYCRQADTATLVDELLRGAT